MGMNRITESLYSKYGINEKKPLIEGRRRNKKFLKEGMFDDIAEDLGYTIYEEDQYGTMYTKTHHVYKNGRDVDWLSTIEVTNDGQCHVDIYDENEDQVGSINSDSFEKAVKYVDKVIRIRQDNPYVTIYDESYLKEELATPIGNISDKEVKQKLKSAQNLIKERGTEDHIYAINVAYYVKNNKSAYPGFGEVSSKKEYKNMMQQVCNSFKVKEPDISFKTVFNKNINEKYSLTKSYSRKNRFLNENMQNVSGPLIKLAKDHSFKVIDLDDDVLHVLKRFTPNYEVGVYAELNNDDSFKTIEADIYFNGDELNNTKYFDTFEKAIDWCERVIPIITKNANEIITIEYFWDDKEDIEDANDTIEDIKKYYNIDTININETSDWGDEFEVTLKGKKYDLLTYLIEDERLDIDEIIAEYPEFQNAVSITEKFYINEMALKESPVINTTTNSYKQHVQAVKNILAQINNVAKQPKKDDIIFVYKLIKNNLMFDVENNALSWEANEIDTDALCATYDKCIEAFGNLYEKLLKNTSLWDKRYYELLDLLKKLETDSGLGIKYSRQLKSNESYKLKEALMPGKIYKINCSHNRLAKFQYVDYDENGYKFKPLNAIAKKFAKEMAESDNLEYDGFLYLDDYGIEVYLDKYKINESLTELTESYLDDHKDELLEILINNGIDQQKAIKIVNEFGFINIKNLEDVSEYFNDEPTPGFYDAYRKAKDYDRSSPVPPYKATMIVTESVPIPYNILKNILKNEGWYSPDGYKYFKDKDEFELYDYVRREEG